MLPTWKRTARHYQKPEIIGLKSGFKLAMSTWLIVGHIRMPLDTYLILNEYEDAVEFKLWGLNFILGSIYVPKPELIDCDQEKMLFSKRQIIGFKESKLKIAIPTKWKERLFDL